MSEVALGDRVKRQDVVEAFQELLGRPPESETTIAYFMRTFSTVEDMRTVIRSSHEYARKASSPFLHYHAAVDVAGTIARHENPDRTARPGHITNFLGVAFDARFATAVADRAGQVEPLPIPANWHADMAEWAAALRAVDLARNSFTMVELGCGWGCWMTNTGVAAKRRGLAAHVIGVEGDEGHLGFARSVFATNGIGPAEYTLHHGIAAAQGGSALFPRQDHAGEKWNLQPLFNASGADQRAALATGLYEELPMLSLSEVIGDRPRVDLLHIDIQGGEADLIRDCAPLLTEKVAYLVIGTHSRQIEGQLFDTLLKAGWTLEIERPAIVALLEDGPLVTTDGVQGWRNPRL